MPLVMVLSGDEDLSRRVSDALGGEASVIARVSTADAAYRALRDGTPDLAVLEVTPDHAVECDELLVGLLAAPERPSVVLLAAPAARSAAAALIARGAFAVLALPLDDAEARPLLRRALAHGALERERARAFADYESARSLVQDVVANVSEAVVLLDAKLVVLEANDEAARLLLKARRELVGSRLELPFGAPIVELMKKARLAGGRASGELSLASGEATLELRGRAAVVRDDGERPVGALVVLREVGA